MVGLEGLRKVFQTLVVPFYTDNGILASPYPARIQEALDVLTGIFDQVGLKKKSTRWSECHANHVTLTKDIPRWCTIGR